MNPNRSAFPLAPQPSPLALAGMRTLILVALACSSLLAADSHSDPESIMAIERQIAPLKQRLAEEREAYVRRNIGSLPRAVEVAPGDDPRPSEVAANEKAKQLNRNANGVEKLLRMIAERREKGLYDGPQRPAMMTMVYDFPKDAENVYRCYVDTYNAMASNGLAVRPANAGEAGEEQKPKGKITAKLADGTIVEQ